MVCYKQQDKLFNATYNLILSLAFSCSPKRVAAGRFGKMFTTTRNCRFQPGSALRCAQLPSSVPEVPAVPRLALDIAWQEDHRLKPGIVDPIRPQHRVLLPSCCDGAFCQPPMSQTRGVRHVPYSRHIPCTRTPNEDGSLRHGHSFSLRTPLLLKILQNVGIESLSSCS